MHVAVAIVGFRNVDDIVRCLAALAKSDHEDFEVIICENGGDAAFLALKEALAATLPGGQPVRVTLASHNLGFAGGVNACLQATADADAWWVLNPDTEPRAGAMAALVERLSKGDCEAAGTTLQLLNGKIQSYGGVWQAWLARPVSIGNGSAPEIPPVPARIEAAQNYLNGASMMITRRFLQTVGPMREDYFLYCEEVEWSLRALRLGLRLGFAPGALVMHRQGATTGNVSTLSKRPRMPIYLGERNKMLLTRDCYPMRLPIAALSAFVQVVVRYGRRGAWSQVGYGLSGWAAGLRNLRGAPSWFAHLVDPAPVTSIPETA